MTHAIALSLANVRSGKGGPFAALIVRKGKIISRAANRVTSLNDPTAHAEILAIRRACRKLGRFNLSGCQIYATCEPCPMCLAAIYWARISRIYFANTTADAARIGFADSRIREKMHRLPWRRRIPMVPLLRDEALEAFRTWRLKKDKIRY